MSTFLPQSILVTGGAGFIGSNFVRYILKNHESISCINVDKITYCSRYPEVDSPIYKFYRCDITDADQILSILNQHNIDTIVHFAAQTHVDRSFGNSLVFTNDNIKGTHTLLEAVKEYGKIKRFLHISTDEVYGEVSDSHEGCIEESLLNPTNPYAATKASAEFLVRSYGQSFKIPFIITRGNNVYGRYQYPDKIIPKFILHLLNGEKLPIHGAGESRRNFINVEDVCNAVWIALTRGKLGEIYNIGSEDEFSVMDIAEKLVQELKPGESLEDHLEYVPDREYNDHRYSINVGQLLGLGWEPKIRFEDGLKDVISWYKANRSYWSSKRKFLVYGAKGWIGQKICKFINENGDIAIEATSRADNLEAVQTEIRKIGPDRVISSIGRTHGPGFATIDYLEQPGKLIENIRDNLYGPLTLARVCEEMNIHFSYIGTGCIFTYEEEDRSFSEGDSPNFFGSQYSTVKGFTDGLMSHFKNTLNCRIRMPISADDSPRNFIKKITTYEYIHSVPNSMSVLESLLPIMIDLSGRKVTGCINLTNPGVISHNDILQLYKDIVDPSFTWKNFSEEDLKKRVAAPRSNNKLDTRRLESLCPKVPSIRDGVIQVLKEMKSGI